MKNPLSPSSSSQNTKSTLPPQQSSSKRRLPRWVVFVLVGVVIVMGVIVIYNMMNGGSMNIGKSVEQRKMEEYLEEKYGEEFEISDIKRNGYGVGVQGHIEAIAKPSRDGSLQFRVMYNEPDHIEDNYVGVLLSKDELSRAETIVSEIYSGLDAPSTTVNIYLSGPLKESPKESTLESLLTHSPENVWYEMLIKSTKPMDTDNQTGAKSILGIIEKLKSIGIIKYNIQYYFATTDNRHFKCNIEAVNTQKLIENMNILDVCEENK